MLNYQLYTLPLNERRVKTRVSEKSRYTLRLEPPGDPSTDPFRLPFPESSFSAIDHGKESSCVEQIEYQERPEMANARRECYKALKRLKAKLRKTKERHRSRYARLVRKYSYGNRTITKANSRRSVVVRYKRDVWGTTTKVVYYSESRLDYLTRMIHDKTVTKSDRERFAREYAYVIMHKADPRVNTQRLAARRITIPTILHRRGDVRYIRPELYRKRVPRRDWPRINSEWATIQHKYRLDVMAQYTQIQRLRDQLEAVSFKRGALPNVMWNECYEAPLPKFAFERRTWTGNVDSRLSGRLNMFRHACTYMGERSTPDLPDPGYRHHGAIKKVHPLKIKLIYPDRTYIEAVNYSPELRIAEDIMSSGSPWIWAGSAAPWASARCVQRWGYVGARPLEPEYAKHVYAGGADVPPMELKIEIHPERMDFVPALVYDETSPELETVGHIESMQADFEERRIMALNGLLALNSDKDARVFNMARSVGELKDLPQTFYSGAEFFGFVGAFTNPVEYLEYKTTGGIHRFIRRQDVRITTSEPRDLTALAMAVTHKRRQGGVAWAKFRKVTRATPLRSIASLYLAWKFGISQTMADTETVMKHGWAWSCLCWRWLERLCSKLPAGKGCVPIRRMYRVSGDAYSASKKLASYEEVRQRSTGSKTWNVSFDLTDHWLAFYDDEAWNRVNTRGPWVIVKDQMIPVCESDGLWMGSPVMESVLRFPNAGSISAAYYDAIDAHNRACIDEALRACGCEPHTYINQDCRGVVFARYGETALMRLFRQRMLNMNAQLMPFLTAWELAPLSFVSEWFTNVRSLIVAAQAMLTRTEAAVSPIGKPWDMQSMHVWAGTLGAIVPLKLRNFYTRYGQLATAEARDYEDDYREVLWHHHTVATRVSFTLEIDPPEREIVTMRKTKLRAASRHAWVGETFELPRLRLKNNMNLGKTISLLAMLTNRRWKF